MNTLPRDLIIQHIIPFTYSPQCKNLQRDIITYYFIITRLKKLYQETLVSNYTEKQLYWLNRYISVRNDTTLVLGKPNGIIISHKIIK